MSGKGHILLQPRFKMSKINVITQSICLDTVIPLYYVIIDYHYINLLRKKMPYAYPKLKN